MQTDKRNGSERGTAPMVQERLALECRTTVISAAQAFEGRTAALVSLVKERGHRGRFDLLTVLDPWELARPSGKALLDQVAADAALALKLHNGEQVLIAVEGDAEPIAAALKAHRAFRGAGVPIEGIDLRQAGRQADHQAPVLSAVAVTCMDFRQHDGDLRQQLMRSLDLPDTPAVLAMAGGAKDLDGVSLRSHLVRGQLQKIRQAGGLSRIAMTCHTDCGAFHGDAAFSGESHQREVLTEHLLRALAWLGPMFPSVSFTAGIVRIMDGRVERIIPVKP